jgi:hypothetical protein
MGTGQVERPVPTYPLQSIPAKVGIQDISGFHTFAAQSIHYFVSTIACGFFNGMETNEPY